MPDGIPPLSAVTAPTSIEYRDDRVWLTNEKMLETVVHELTAERDFLREMLRLALASNQERKPE